MPPVCPLSPNRQAPPGLAAALRLWARRMGFAVLALAAVGLVGGLSGVTELGSVLRGKVPMALSTASLFLATGALLAGRRPGAPQAPAPGLPWPRQAAPAWPALALRLFLYAAIELVAVINALGFAWPSLDRFDPADLLGEAVQDALGVPFTPMSPFTGLMFSWVGASLLLLECSTGQDPPALVRRCLAGMLALFALLGGLTFTLGYLYGTPLFYGNGVVPVAFTTALAFMLAAVGLICLAGPFCLPLAPFVGPSVSARLMRTFTPLTASFGLVSPLVIQAVLNSVTYFNAALLISCTAMAFAGLTSLVVSSIGRGLGHSIDQAEQARDQAQEQLRASEERFRQLIEQAPEAILVIDPEHDRCVLANANAEALFGVSRQELLQSGHSRFFAPLQPGGFDVAGLVAESRRRALLGEQVIREVDVTNARGEQLHCEVRLVLLPTNGRSLLRASYIDITRRVEASRQLVRQTTMLEGLLDSIPDLVFFKDTQGVYLGCNARFEDFVGKPRRDIVGHTDRDLFPVNVATEFRANDVLMLQTGQPRHNEEWVSYPGGARVLLDTFKAPLRESGGITVGVLGVSRDITERHQAQESMARSLAEKTVLLREVHHRVKNNLQILMSLVSLQAGQASSQGEQEALKAMEGRIRSMALAHERLYHSPDLSAVDMPEYVRELISHTGAAFHGLAAQVATEVQVDDCALSVDKAIPLGLLLTELITNAYKHAFAKGASSLTVRLTRQDGGCLLVVADDGPGLPEGFAPNQASGLGMQLIVALAGQLKGSFTWSQGPGARFELSFPLA